MTLLKPDELAKRLKEELLKIDGDEKLLPEINNSNDFAKPYIEIDRYGYNYICRERGEEISRKIPLNTEWLIFEVFKGITFVMASNWECENRKEKEDTRKQLFKKQIEFLAKINPEYGDRIQNEIDQILRISPYSDV